MNKHANRNLIKLEASYIKSCSHNAKKGSKVRAQGYLYIAYLKAGFTKEEILERFKKLQSEGNV